MLVIFILFYLQMLFKDKDHFDSVFPANKSYTNADNTTHSEIHFPHVMEAIWSSVAAVLVLLLFIIGWCIRKHYCKNTEQPEQESGFAVQYRDLTDDDGDDTQTDEEHPTEFQANEHESDAASNESATDEDHSIEFQANEHESDTESNTSYEDQEFDYLDDGPHEAGRRI